MILSKEQYFETVKKIIGEDTTEEALKLLEDLTDTYNATEKPADKDLEKKFADLEKKHADLTNRYKERFFAPSKGDPEPAPTLPGNEPENENPDAGVSYAELLGGK